VRRPSFAFAWALSSLVFLATPARGQSPVAAPPPAGNELVPPTLVEFVPAVLGDAEPPAVTTRVLLEFVVDVEGRVSDVKVVESAGELDRPAVEAAQKFRFEPARRGGVPVPVSIRYAYVFEAKPPEPESEPPPAPVPAPATVAVEAPPAPPPESTQTPAGSAEEIPEFEATARVEAPQTEVTRRDLDATAIRRVAGTRGDVLKSVEILPGVARPTDGGDPILRGAASYESKTYLNGTPVPFLYHFGGLASFMSPYLVERLELRPSNFSVRYGRVAGGIVEVKARDPESERLKAVVDLNLIDSSAYVEFPIGDNAGFAAAARRSNIDFFFEAFVPEDAYSVVAAPVYYDYQAIGRIDLGANTRLRLMGYGSRDTIELFIDDTGDDPAFSGNIEGKLQSHRAAVELESHSGAVSGSVSATFGYTEIVQHFGELEQRLRGPELYARGELGVELARNLRLGLGADAWIYFYDGWYHGPYPGQLEGDPKDQTPFGSQRLVSDVDKGMDAASPGAYVDLAYRPVDALLVTPGVRVDYYGAFGAFSVDPRLSTRLEVSPHTTLKGGVGSYSQAPEFWQALDSVGNPDLKPYRAIQTSLGVEQRAGESLELGVEGFYKHLDDVVVTTPNREAPHYTNDGKGRVYGAEFSLEASWPSDGRAYGAYTLSRSERRDYGGGYRLFDSDQTHILSLAASQGLGAGWDVGLRFRLVSGNPTTPIAGAVYDARTGLYLPTFGATNSDRNPTFHQLDARVEKRWVMGAFALATYLDVQNVYNAENQEGVRYSYDYSESENVTGLPFFPSIGLRGEL
jgi:TonB family protein